jgi:hypothetical protein
MIPKNRDSSGTVQLYIVGLGFVRSDESNGAFVSVRWMRRASCCMSGRERDAPGRCAGRCASFGGGPQSFRVGPRRIVSDDFGDFAREINELRRDRDLTFAPVTPEVASSSLVDPAIHDQRNCSVI